MAEKKPLCLYDGQPKELQSGDTLPGGGGEVWVTKTGDYTAVADDNIKLDSHAGAFIITLPASPNAGDTIQLLDIVGSCRTYNVTVNRNGNNIESVAENLILNRNGVYVRIEYVDATIGYSIRRITWNN